MPLSPTQRIANWYHAVTVKGAWHGPTLADLLARTPADLATTPPRPGAHSISALLQHLLLWNERIRLTSDAHPLPRWEAEKEWAALPIPWPELLTRWSQSRDLLEQRIREFPIDDLSKQVPGRTYPYEFMFEGIVHHTIYHSGQIAMLLTLLRTS
jgi:uncharacterized damage-inducible protein DinB